MTELIPIKQWFPEFEARVPLIAGPCSAETESQVLQTAEALAKTGLPIIFRSGVWKPRTKPGGFEGAGLKALKWLQTVKERYGFKTTVEVANEEHTLMALDHDIDMLWIGARTSVNPFSVQEIADVLKKHPEKAVMVKNPINADLNLWIGALERFHNAGIRKLAGIHRGFSTWEKSDYRNPPKWEFPIELMRQYPDLDIFCDPSHICGKRNTLEYVAQKAFDLSMSGLMLESHINPDEAWTDAKQQLTPAALLLLIERIKVRDGSADSDSNKRLLELREGIDSIDHDILRKIKERMLLVDEIGAHKKAHNIGILQVERWNEIVRDRLQLGKDLELDTDFLRIFMEQIHKSSIQRQTKILNNSAIHHDA